MGRGESHRFVCESWLVPLCRTLYSNWRNSISGYCLRTKGYLFPCRLLKIFKGDDVVIKGVKVVRGVNSRHFIILIWVSTSL